MTILLSHPHRLCALERAVPGLSGTLAGEPCPDSGAIEKYFTITLEMLSEACKILYRVDGTHTARETRHEDSQD